MLMFEMFFFLVNDLSIEAKVKLHRFGQFLHCGSVIFRIIIFSFFLHYEIYRFPKLGDFVDAFFGNPSPKKCMQN